MQYHYQEQPIRYANWCLSEYQLVGQEATEYNFHDFRWARLERLRRGTASSANVALDESLLEYNPGGETVVSSRAASPRLEVLDVNHALLKTSSQQPPQSLASINTSQASQQLTSNRMEQADETLPYQWLSENDAAAQSLLFDWPQLLGESGHLEQQTGDPTTFWNQL